MLLLKHVDGIKVFSKLAVYDRRQLKEMENTSRISDSTKKNQKALQQLDALNKESLEVSQPNEGEGDQGTDGADFLLDEDEVQDANGAAGEEDDVAAEQVENAGAAEQGGEALER